MVRITNLFLCYNLYGDNMRLIIASDIHGNVPNTEKLIQAIEKYKPDNIILLGDLLSSYGMDYEIYDRYQVATLLNNYANKIVAVKGNCDSYEDNELFIFNNRENYQDFNIDGIKFILTHGHMYNSLFNEAEYTLEGHTHYYNLKTNHINPGSIGLPRGGNPPTYILYENKKFYLIDLDTNKIIEEKELI